MTVTATIEDH